MEDDKKYEIPENLIPTDENKYKGDGEKKKHPILNFIGGTVFVLGVVFVAEILLPVLLYDDEATETVTVETEEPAPEKPLETEEVEEQTQIGNYEIDAVLPGNPNYDDYIHVGNSYDFKNNGSMDILDAWYGGYENGNLFVLVEFTAGDEPLRVNYTNATLYVDDYEFPLNAGVDGVASYGSILSGDTTYPTFVDINASGRKGMMVFLATFPEDLTESSDVEFDIIGGIFKINPLSVIHANDEAEAKAQAEAMERYESIRVKGTDILYAKYVTVDDESDDDNETKAYNELYVEPASDGTDDGMIIIDHRTMGEYDLSEPFEDAFYGTIKVDGDVCGIYDYSGTLVFRVYNESGTILVETVDPDLAEDIDRFSGRYTYLSGLNYDEVS